MDTVMGFVGRLQKNKLFVDRLILNLGAIPVFMIFVAPSSWLHVYGLVSNMQVQYNKRNYTSRIGCI